MHKLIDWRPTLKSFGWWPMHKLVSRWTPCHIGLIALVALAGCGGGSAPEKLSFDEQVRRAARQSSPDLRARELIRIAGEQFQAKDNAGAMQTLKLARQAADEVGDLATRAGVYCAGAEALARAGQSSTAGEFIRAAAAAAEKIEDLESRARQFARVAQAQARLSPDDAQATLQQTEKLAEGIPDVYGRVLVLALVGRSYDTLGRSEEGQRVFSAALLLAGSIEEAQRRTMALAEVALQQAMAKRQEESQKTFQQALQQSEQVQPVLARVHAMANVAEKLSRAGSPARAHQLLIQAEKLAASIPQPDAQNEALLLVRSLMAKLPPQ
jgi:hypothetical protein